MGRREHQNLRLDGQLGDVLDHGVKRDPLLLRIE